MTWIYDRNTIDRIISCADILDGRKPDSFAAEILFRDCNDMARSPVGKQILETAVSMNCHLSLIPDLPYFGITVPAGQAAEGVNGPLILMDGTQSTWDSKQGLGLFVLAHELTHVMQDKNKQLHAYALAGITYKFPEDAPIDAQGDLTILTERTADLGAVLTCLTVPDRAAEIACHLRTEPSLFQLFEDCSQALRRHAVDDSFVKKMITPDLIESEALRYYMGYLPKGLSQTFNMTAAPDVSPWVEKNAQAIGSCLESLRSAPPEGRHPTIFN